MYLDLSLTAWHCAQWHHDTAFPPLRTRKSIVRGWGDARSHLDIAMSINR